MTHDADAATAMIGAGATGAVTTGATVTAIAAAPNGKRLRDRRLRFNRAEAPPLPAERASRRHRRRSARRGRRHVPNRARRRLRLCVGSDVPRRPTSQADRADAVPSERERAKLLAALDGGKDSVALAVGGHEIDLTHLGRVYWPQEPGLRQASITKRDFVRYCIAVAPAMLPHLADRPLTLFRWPEGIAGRRVLDKHWKITLPPFVERVNVFSESKGHADQYLLCNNLATLIWLAQMGTLELHAWHSRVRPGSDAPLASADFTSSVSALQSSVLELPDYVLFDIDPFIYAGMEPKGREPAFSAPAFEEARRVALWLKDLLDGIALESLVKTSGKTGLHVIVPICRTLPFDAVREFARFIGDHLKRLHPKEITVDWSVAKRSGKVFMDGNMNVRGKSISTPYSPRGLAGAPVSMPLTWSNLQHAEPPDFRVTSVLPLLRKHGDAWAGWLERKQNVEKSLKRQAA
jgi:bifunctional non-homologous end joining protein LigD